MSRLNHLVKDGLLHRASFFLSTTLQLGVILRSLSFLFLLYFLYPSFQSFIPSAKADGLFFFSYFTKRLKQVLTRDEDVGDPSDKQGVNKVGYPSRMFLSLVLAKHTGPASPTGLPLAPRLSDNMQLMVLKMPTLQQPEAQVFKCLYFFISLHLWGACKTDSGLRFVCFNQWHFKNLQTK